MTSPCPRVSCADTPVIAMQQDFWAGSDQTLVVAGPSADLSWFVFPMTPWNPRPATPACASSM